MFTGLIEDVGTVAAVERVAKGVRLSVRTRLPGLDHGGSIAVDGACLTAVELSGDRFTADVSAETLDKTTLGERKAGDRVNLERPLALGDRLGGHLVLGHVDGIGTVTDVTRVESTARVRIALPGPALAPLLVEQGSVAVDGVSLTVAALERLAFEVMVIPHTLAVTTFGRLTAGRTVNIETDVIGKYLQRSLALKGAS
jgi:riboflavin synthase